MIKVRPAQANDLDEIMRVEYESWKSIPEAMVDRETAGARIALFNGHEPGWLWVAQKERNGRLLGHMVLLPTDLEPSECTSWEIATDQGRLVGTFNPNGRNLFGVSLSVPNTSPLGTAQLLVCKSMALRAAKQMQYYMFCARMPGFLAMHNKTGIEPEDYWKLTRRNGLPRDPQLKEYFRMFGEPPVRLMPNGFPPDKMSGGHSVLFVSTNALLALETVAKRILTVGMAAGHRAK